MSNLDNTILELKGILGDKLEGRLESLLMSAEAEQGVTGNKVKELTTVAGAAIAQLKDAKKTEEIITRLEGMTKAIENMEGALSSKTGNVSVAILEQTKELLEGLSMNSVSVRNLQDIDFSAIAKQMPKEFNSKIVNIVKTISEQPNESNLEYDTMGRVRRVTEIYNNFTVVTSFTYNNDGRVTKIVTEGQ